MTKRIASFLPSATEILYELGVGDQIVGVTHECNFPDAAKSKPRVIHSSFDPEKMSSKEIDKKIVELMTSGSAIYVVDEPVLKKANPDLIIAQGLCEVCAPHTNEVNRAVSILDNKPQVQILDPHSLGDILENIIEIAKALNKETEGSKLIVSLKKRIDFVKQTSRENRPKVVCLEWLDPFFTAGHWIPEIVETAGGINGISKVRERSRRMKIDEIKKFDPDLIILMPCGFNVHRTVNEYSTVKNGNEWTTLRAVRNGNVYAVDANPYFSKPSIRTVTGLEILAKIIHPEKFDDLIIPKNSFRQIIPE